MCRLHAYADMQNRWHHRPRAPLGRSEATPSLTSNSLLGLYTHVKTGPGPASMPAKLATRLDWRRRPQHPVVDPVVTYVYRLVIPQRDPMTPLIAGALSTPSAKSPDAES